MKYQRINQNLPAAFGVAELSSQRTFKINAVSNADKHKK